MQNTIQTIVQRGKVQSDKRSEKKGENFRIQIDEIEHTAEMFV